MTGYFISFEGAEGVGKSTQIQLLADKLTAEGHEVVVTREPGGTALGESVRGILQYDTTGEAVSDNAELLLFAACRAQLVDTVIKPSLMQGKVVLCDRFYDSTLAYQGYGRGVDQQTIHVLCELAIDGVRPDLTFLMDMPTSVALQRMRDRAGDSKLDRIEREPDDFHIRVAEGFRAIASKETQRIITINAEDDIDTNAAHIWRTVCDKRA